MQDKIADDLDSRLSIFTLRGMGFTIRPWHVFLLGLSSWANRQQQHAIEYLITENQVLKERLGKKRIFLNDHQRRRLAVKGKVLGRKLLLEVATIVTPDTILRRHRNVSARQPGERS